MIEIQDADSDVGKIGLEKPPKASGTIIDENHLLGRGHAPLDSFEPPEAEKEALRKKIAGEA